MLYEKICGICNRPFTTHYSSKKSCSISCYRKQQYWSDPEKAKREAKEYRINNPDKYRKYGKKNFARWYSKKENRLKQLSKLKKDYLKNKHKWLCRIRTRIIVSRDKTINKKCKICRLYDSEIHHEIYPTEWSEIKKAIKQGKIYYLCKEHHSLLRRGASYSRSN